MNPHIAQPLWDNFEHAADFWHTLTNEQRAVLESAREEYHLSKGELVFRQGEMPQQLFYVHAGTVKVSREGGAGKYQILRFVSQGDILGYGAALTNEPYVVSAEAFDDCIIWAFPQGIMQHLIQQSPEVAQYMLQRLARELEAADCRLVSLTQAHLRGRMAETLLFLHHAHFVQNGLDVLSHLTRRELAALSNMSTSNAIRTLSQLAEEGLISVEGRHIRLLDVHRLQFVALQC